MRHAMWSGLLALGLFILFFLEPVDQFFWALQTRTNSKPPSGQIVFAGTDSDLADRTSPERRSELARVLRGLDRAGAAKVYVDFAFDKPSTAAIDGRLANALDALGDRVVLVDRVVSDLDRNEQLVASIPAIRGKTNVVAFGRSDDYLGYTWTLPFRETVAGHSLPGFASALAGKSGPSDELFPVDYRYRPGSIPQLRYDSLLLPTNGDAASPSLSGKTVVIGRGHRVPGATVAIPGQSNVPEAMLAIVGAETLMANQLVSISGLWVIALTGLVLIAILALARSPGWRRAGYASLAASLFAAFLLAPAFDLRIELAYGFAVAGLFAVLRLRSKWQERAALTDLETGLPTLRALDRRLSQTQPKGSVVVAWIRGHERVLRTLPHALHTAYVLRIADRLRALEPELELYFGGHYFAWHSQTTDRSALTEHLTGMRALFAAPLQIGEHTIDSGITFGVANIGIRGSGHLAAAIAATEETSEAHEPVRFADSRSEREELWDLSLRARIDAAIASAEVYCVYQPKIDARTRDVVGVEALVRWDDPERGSIPPMHFIRECEKAGRMEDLTRYVLQSACNAGRLFHQRGMRLSVSVNISATLCSDVRIVHMVRSVLQGSGFDPRFLVLEVTETALISDLSSAALVLNQLRALGLKLSIDDFGVGSANFETFYELPFDELKIDRLFIKDIAADPKARAIASSLVTMGRDARISIVAEGVENPADLEILSRWGCTEVQGYAVSKPQKLANLLQFLDNYGQNARKNVV